jgi:ribosomal protein S4
MVKCVKTKLRKLRRFGFMPDLTAKSLKNRIFTPGVHAKQLPTFKTRQFVAEDYNTNLRNAQKFRYNYALTKTKIKNYLKQLRKYKTNKNAHLNRLLESRLDVLVRRSGFAKSIVEARQLVSHGHILINGKKTKSSNLICQSGDFISANNTVNSETKTQENLSWHLQQSYANIKFALLTSFYKKLKDRYKNTYTYMVQTKKKKYFRNYIRKICTPKVISQLVAQPRENSIISKFLFKY